MIGSSDLSKKCKKNHFDRKIKRVVRPFKKLQKSHWQKIDGTPLSRQLPSGSAVAASGNSGPHRELACAGNNCEKTPFLSNFDSYNKQSRQKNFLLDFDNNYKYPVMTPSCSSSWTTPSTAVWPLFETWDHEMMSRSKNSNHSIKRSINKFLFRSHQKRHARQTHLLQIYFRFTTAD